MAQPSVAAFFNTRKRAAGEDATNLKSKRLIDGGTQDDGIATIPSGVRTRSGRTVKRIGPSEPSDPVDVVPKKVSRIERKRDAEREIKQQAKLEQFIKKGPLSPHKKTPISEVQRAQKANEETPTATMPSATAINAFASKNNAANVERGFRTPTKQIIKTGATPLKHPTELKSMVKKELNFDEVKSKVTRSEKLNELKASLARIQELEKTRKAQEEKNRKLREGGVSKAAPKAAVVQLKEFDKIELEVLTSPSKTFKTPTKLPPPTPDKNELMSPRHTDVSKRVLFSPSKNGSPSKLIVPPAYQRFLSLASPVKATQLSLPFKYRHLVEIFKAVDSVCSMFHNRKECITFKKLKPAVQRMLRKNFTEIHLAQIKQLFPDAYTFTQMKMRNYGSTSKADYFQLVITPNVENANPNNINIVEEDNIMAAAQANSMNPHVMTERLRYFQHVLIERVKGYHDEFLKSLDPPLLIPKAKVTRWHPDFDLENCPEVELGHLPQPPNVEKYSSARDILSTARNLFNCATPMERVMQRYEAKLEADRVPNTTAQNNDLGISPLPKERPTSVTEAPAGKISSSNSASNPVSGTETAAAPDVTSTLLKGVPKSLLDRIRAKQAAKALDAMTRRPSQDQEAVQYSRLPELARHLRNVFITERKGVLTLEIVIAKIQNSFRTCLTPQEIEAHLRMMSKEVPDWVAFHEVRKTMYLKITKEMDLAKVVERLEAIANEKSK